MTREVLATDAHGNPTAWVFRESAAERAERDAERREQAARAQEVEASLRAPAATYASR